MGRKRKWPPTVLPHTPSGLDRIRVDGIDYWLGPIDSEESRREYARLVGELAGGAPEPPRKKSWPKLVELVEIVESKYLPSQSEKEANHVRRAMAVMVASGRGSIRVDEFTLARLAEVRRAMLETPPIRQFAGDRRREPGWSCSHTNAQVRRIRTMWRWAEEQGYVPPGSWAGLLALKPLRSHDRSVRQTPKTRPADESHLESVLLHIRSKPVRAMLRLQWLTGMRSGEIRTMSVGEIDTSEDVWLYRPKWHKNTWRGQDRTIPLGPQAQSLLRPFLKGKKADSPVFRNRNGKQYSAAAYGLAGRRAGKKAGLEWFRPYCLRHGAKQRITKEMGLDVARSVLGQKSIGTTDRYGDSIDLDQARAAARKMG